MKYLLFAFVALFVVAGTATAGDWHTGSTLVCNDCHVAHYSQSHGYTTAGGVFPPLGTAGPYSYLLRNDVNLLCLACHDGNVYPQDVFGVNTNAAEVRQGGGLNIAAGHGLTNDAGYDEIDGHTLYSMDTPPGFVGTYDPGHGLECTNCHMPHGHVETQYVNLWNRSTPITYNRGTPGTIDLTKDVFQRAILDHSIDQIDFNEPDQTASAYANWCGQCHTNFHGAGGSTEMGSQPGGELPFGGAPWVRHPVQDVNIGQAASFISDLATFYANTNRVKVMSPAGDWSGTDTEVTQSCMSCHKAHGNMNGFGLIFMSGTGTITEEGDGGVYKDLCQQCHIQG